MTTLTERDDLLGMISDDYKVLYGIRPRGYKFDEMSIEELRNWHKEICESIRREMEYEKAEELAHEQAMTKAFQKTPWTLGEILRLS